MIKNELQNGFDCRLKDLGIDPEWITIPIATFNEKMQTIRHRQNILCKVSNTSIYYIFYYHDQN
jgi:hypothetical protein